MKTILTILLLSGTAYAEIGYTLVDNGNLQSQRDWDHMGTSYAVYMLNYGIWNKGFGLKPRDARLFSLVSTFILTTVYEIGAQGSNGPLIDGRAVGMNMLGAGAALATTWMFKWGEPNESLGDYDKRIHRERMDLPRLPQ